MTRSFPKRSRNNMQAPPRYPDCGTASGTPPAAWMMQAASEVVGDCLGTTHVNSSSSTLDDEEEVDFGALHDEFVQGLLLQEMQQQQDFQDAAFPRSRSNNSLSSWTSKNSQTSVATSASWRHRSPKFAATAASHLARSDSASEDVVISEESSFMNDDTNEDLDESFAALHPQVQLQKDKGKGEAWGSKICAQGRTAVARKVQDKIQLLCHIAREGGGNSPVVNAQNMVQRPAVVVTARSSPTTMVETRSLMELRLGFLSMHYGIGLQWNVQTRTIVLIVLRKLCSDSFYPKRRGAAANSKAFTKASSGSTPSERMSSTRMADSSGRNVQPWIVPGEKGAPTAIYPKDGAAEVVSVHPPYCVDPQEDDSDIQIGVAIQSLQGQAPSHAHHGRSKRVRPPQDIKYTLMAVYHDNGRQRRQRHQEAPLQVHATLLTYSVPQGTWIPALRRNQDPQVVLWPALQESNENTHVQLHLIPGWTSSASTTWRRSVVATWTIPISQGLLAQPTQAPHVTIPLELHSTTTNSSSSSWMTLNVQLHLQSRRGFWLYQELQARQQQEQQRSSSPQTVVRFPDEELDDDYYIGDDEDDAFWDWCLCGGATSLC